MAIPSPEEYAKAMAARHQRERGTQDKVEALYNTTPARVIEMMRQQAAALQKAMKAQEDAHHASAAMAASVEKLYKDIDPQDIAAVNTTMGELVQMGERLSRQVQELAESVKTMQTDKDAINMAIRRMAVEKPAQPQTNVMPTGTARLNIKKRDQNGDIKLIDVVYGVPVKE